MNNKFRHLIEIKELYEKGENIIKYLRGLELSDQNSFEDILISYDLQSGTYVDSYFKNKDFKDNYASAIASVINNLAGSDKFKTILEIGVGEATTLAPLIKNLDLDVDMAYGLDISLSRLLFGNAFAKFMGIEKIQLFTANLFKIPLPDNSIDIVYTSHSIEPNGGREKEALKELYRIAGRYVVLLEPSYDMADDKGKIRMKKNGYITNLPLHASELGYSIIERRPFDHIINPLNPTELLIIEKHNVKKNDAVFVCPWTGKKLDLINKNQLYSKESGYIYPVINDIPCLCPENAIQTFDSQEVENIFSKN